MERFWLASYWKHCVSADCESDVVTALVISPGGRLVAHRRRVGGAELREKPRLPPRDVVRGDEGFRW